MQVTVLGRYSPWAPPGGALSGYLVRHGGTTVLVDCGNGVGGRLQEYMPAWELTAVVVSHLHEDHIGDLHQLRFMQLHAQMNKITDQKLQIYAPAEPAARLQWINGGEQWQDLHHYNPNQVLTVGELEFRFTRTNHPIPCYAMRISPVGGGPTLFYTADTGIHPPLVEAAKGADLLIIEASLTEEYNSKRQFGHLTAAEAAQFAKDAEVRRCLFSHLYPGLDLQHLLGEGKAVYAGIELAEERETYTLA